MAPKLCAEQFERGQMHALAQGIAHLQHADDLVGKGLDHGYLEPETEILHLGASDLLSLSSVSVRTASACRHCNIAGGDFASPSISTEAPLPPAHRAADRRG